jgi:hypothetical protein
MFNLSVGSLNLLGLQEVKGSPSVPAGQVHVGLWLETEQMALELHGFSCTQGLMQLLDRHAKLRGHSSSAEQPTSTGAAWE